MGRARAQAPQRTGRARALDHQRARQHTRCITKRICLDLDSATYDAWLKAAALDDRDLKAGIGRRCWGSDSPAASRSPASDRAQVTHSPWLSTDPDPDARPMSAAELFGKNFKEHASATRAELGTQTASAPYARAFGDARGWPGTPTSDRQSR